MRLGRPPKAIKINQRQVAALCANCPLSQCLGTGDPRCPVRIASRKKWSEYNRKRWAAKKAEKETT